MLFPKATVHNIRELFVNLFRNNKLIEDRTGSQTVEIINANFIADEESIFGQPNDAWHSRELEWYLSQSLNVNDIPPPIPKIWQQIADEDGIINSNYGWCIFSSANGDQFIHALSALANNSFTRQAIMIYNRPSMQWEATANGRQDYMCCQNSQHFIRNNTLSSHFNYRSSDAVFGYKGDLFWANYVHNLLFDKLVVSYPDLEKGPIIWNAMSLHVYSRHFHLIEKYATENGL
jgi:thymidylate synthase